MWDVFVLEHVIGSCCIVLWLSIVFPGVPAVHICAVFIFNICAPFSSLWLWLKCLAPGSKAQRPDQCRSIFLRHDCWTCFLSWGAMKPFQSICLTYAISDWPGQFSGLCLTKSKTWCFVPHYRHVCLCIICICMLVCTICWDLFGTVVGICVLDMCIAMFVHWLSCAAVSGSKLERRKVRMEATSAWTSADLPTVVARSLVREASCGKRKWIRKRWVFCLSHSQLSWMQGR